MKHQPALRAATLIVLLLAVSASLCAQQNLWLAPVHVASSASDEWLSTALTAVPVKNMNITDDGNGGMIMCWSSGVAGAYTVNAQRVDASGNLLWTNTNTGMVVATTSADQMRLVQCVGDGAGGAYIGWSGVDAHTGSERHSMQYINPAGQLMWGQLGFVLTPAQATAADPSLNANVLQMDKDGSGGVLVVYYSYTNDVRKGTLNAIRIANTNGLPTTAWGPKTILQRAAGQLFVTSAMPVISSDGSGGAYVGGVTSDADTMFHACVAYINGAGSIVFDNQLTSTLSSINASYGFQIVGDNNGAVLAYILNKDSTNTFSNQSVALRVDNTGSLLWGPTVIHYPTDQNDFYTRIASDGNGGIYAVINDGVKSTGMYLQHIDNLGVVYFKRFSSPSGISLDGIGSTYAQVINDGQGNALCAWSKWGSVYIQKFSPNGLPMSSSPIAAGIGLYPEIAADNAGGAFVGWNVSTSSFDINAEHVGSGAVTGSPHLVAATSMTFPAVAFNQASMLMPLIISNLGSGNLNLSSASTIVGINANEFSIYPGKLPDVITPGSSDTLWISFRPVTSAGSCSAALQLMSNDAAAPTFNVDLSGTSIGLPILLSSTYIDAGHIQIGTHDTVIFSIANAAQATGELILQSLSIDGAFYGDYKLLTPISFPDTLQPGQTLSATVSFTALEGGPLPANMRVVSNSADIIESVPIIGYGLKSSMSAAPVDIGKVELEHCKVFSLPVTNLGTADMRLSSLHFGGSHPEEFQIIGSANILIAPGMTGIVQLQFCPLNVGPQHTVAQLISADQDTLYVDIRGWGGLGGALHTTNQIEFGTLALKEQSTINIEVLNVSDIPTTITGIGFTGTKSLPFAALISTPYSLAPGDSISVPLLFNATATGTFNDTLLLSASDQSVLNVGLYGIVITHPFSIKPTALFTDTIAVGKTETGTVILKNVTSLPQVILNAFLNGPDESAYSVTSAIDAPFSIAPNGADTIAVEFSPLDYSATRVYRAALAIVGTAGDTLNIPFHGAGRVTVTTVNGNAVVPQVYVLAQNYPNPFATSTTLFYALPSRGDVMIVVYDMLGREVQRIAEGVIDAGSYIQTFSGAMLAAGMYSYELRVNGVAQHRMMMQIAR